MVHYEGVWWQCCCAIWTNNLLSVTTSQLKYKHRRIALFMHFFFGFKYALKMYLRAR